MPIFPRSQLADFGVEVGHLAPVEVELATVLLGDVFNVDEGGECRENLGLREDKDLGNGDGVEPALDPAPDGSEEGGCADDLKTARMLALT